MINISSVEYARPIGPSLRPYISARSTDRFSSIRALGELDIRFTRSKDNKVVYAIALGWPAGEFVVQSLGTANAAKVGRVELLGTGEKLRWRRQLSAAHSADK